MNAKSILIGFIAGSIITGGAWALSAKLALDAQGEKAKQMIASPAVAPGTTICDPGPDQWIESGTACHTNPAERIAPPTDNSAQLRDMRPD